MRPIRPKPLIPTLIVIYSTSYLLVNKRLVIELPKPYQSSSGIVSIIAANQTLGPVLSAICTRYLRSAFARYGDKLLSIKIVNSICATKITPSCCTDGIRYSLG
ncbi:hypothetical protein C9426_20975 [Serratia sp. S1B]|nr:hypothetical protein C9426_20975 [Serratia sp. S1B]